MLQDSVQKFVHRHYSFDMRREILASPKGYSDDYWQLFAELGWLTVPFKTEDDGFGGLAVDLMVLMEEFGKSMVVEPFVPTTVLGGGLISELGSTAQKVEWLPQIMSGSVQLACATAEPDSRYNLASVSCTAESRGDSWIVNGQKILVLNGPDADQLLVSVRTSGAKRDADGISVLLIAADSPGVRRTSYTNVDGHRAAEITFTDVSVSADRLLGAKDNALAALEYVTDRAIVAVCAEAVGALDSLLNKTVEYTKTRKQFGTAIATFQALQHRMADMFIECQLARSVVMMAAMRLDSDVALADKMRAVSAAKSRVGKAIRKVGQEAVQMHGGIGITDELDVGHLFKRVTAIETLFGNTDYHTARFSRLG